MQKKFVVNLFLLVAINLLIKPFWILGVERGVQNAVGPAGYGLYYALFNFSFLFNIIIDFGLNNYNNSFISKHPQLLSKQFSQALVLKGLLIIVYLVITLFSAMLYGYKGWALQMLLVLCFNQVLSFGITFLRSCVSGLQFFFTDSLLSVLDRFLMILICGSLLWLGPAGNFNIKWFIISQTASYVITLVISYFVIHPHIRRLVLSFNKPFLISLLKRSAPYALLGVLMSVYTKADGILIERWLTRGAEKAGQYASAYRLLDAANMMGVLFAGLLLPMFSRMLAAKHDLSKLVRTAFVLIFFPSLILSVCCYLYAGPIMSLLSKHCDEEAISVFKWLMLSFIPVCWVYIFGTLLTALGKHKLLIWIALIACVINVGFNLLFMKNYGIQACAISSLLTQLFVGASHIALTFSRLKLHLGKYFLLRIVIFASVFMVVATTISVMPFLWITNMLLTLIGSIAILAFSGFFKGSDLKLIFSKEI